MDSNVSEKLQLLINSKLEIAQSIRDCGVYVSDEDGFLQFPDLIRSISDINELDIFDITDDGVIFLKSKFRGACPSNRSSEFTYAISDNGVGKVGSWNDLLPSIVVIPKALNDKRVTALVGGMFLGNTAVKVIVIPNTITEIPNGFAHLAYNVESVINTENINKIGHRAFQSSGIVNANFPSLTTWGGNQNTGNYFYQAGHLKYANIGHVTTIPKTCFGDCCMLEKIDGDGTITTVEYGSLYNTSSLTQVPFTLDEGTTITRIGAKALLQTKLKIPESWWGTEPNISFDAYSTALQLNRTDIWSDLIVSKKENPLPSAFIQTNPLWDNIVIGGENTAGAGGSALTYHGGCMTCALMMIYCGLYNLELNSPLQVEDIWNELKPGWNNHITSSPDALDDFVNAVGLRCVHKYSEFTAENLQEIYNYISDGKYVLFGVPAANDDYFTATSPNYVERNPIKISHAAVGFGITENKEIMLTHSATANAAVYDFTPLKYAIPYENLFQNGQYSSPSNVQFACVVIDK